MVSTTNTKEACDPAPAMRSRKLSTEKRFWKAAQFLYGTRSHMPNPPGRQLYLSAPPSSASHLLYHHNNAILSSDLSYLFLLGSMLPG